MITSQRVVVEQWDTAFRHSAGKLGSEFLKALASGRILGWRTGNPARVTVPPKDLGLPGEWVEVGPGARLIAYAPREWMRNADPADSCLALVMLAGADTAMLSRVKFDPAKGALAPDTSLRARFCAEPKGAMTDFWFEPEAAC